MTDNLHFRPTPGELDHGASLCLSTGGGDLLWLTTGGNHTTLVADADPAARGKVLMNLVRTTVAENPEVSVQVVDLIGSEALAALAEVDGVDYTTDASGLLGWHRESLARSSMVLNFHPGSGADGEVGDADGLAYLRQVEAAGKLVGWHVPEDRVYVVHADAVPQDTTPGGVNVVAEAFTRGRSVCMGMVLSVPGAALADYDRLVEAAAVVVTGDDADSAAVSDAYHPAEAPLADTGGLGGADCLVSVVGDTRFCVRLPVTLDADAAD